MNAQPFFPGTGEIAALPLGRFLPPVNLGTTAQWLKENVPPGSWILDPIGFTPIVALEAAQAGYHVLVACNNPIISMMLEVLSSAPNQAALQSALAELSLLKRGDERLDIHLQSLYQTTCPSCKQTIHAQSFLWKRGEKEPYAKWIRCPQCGEEGEFPLSEEDYRRLNPPGNPALHRARAIERLISMDDDIRPGVEEALRAYPPRALYFITTLINKIEGANLIPEQRRLLYALILSVCDDGNSLWPWPSGRTRPRQLSTPTQFRENNLWLSLEAAVEVWSSQLFPVKFATWPELPAMSSEEENPSGSICLFQGRIKSLLPLPENISTKAAITAFPRPSQAFWTLSAVWSGWLWGREAVSPLKVALDRQRYDWDWHATALHNSFMALSSHVPANYPFFGIVCESVPSFIGALVLAAQSGGFDIQGMALREDDAALQVSFACAPDKSPSVENPKSKHTAIIDAALEKFFQEKQEPAPYLSLFTSGLLAASDNNFFNLNPQANLRYFADKSKEFEGFFRQALMDPRRYRRYGGSEQNEESGAWWFRDPNLTLGESHLPLADRIEKELVQFLQKHPNCRFAEIENALCRQFPGLLTPAENLLRTCLESYALPSIKDGCECWNLRPEDDPATRRRDIGAVQTALGELAKRIGLKCSGEAPLVWETAPGKVVYAFYPLASSIISRWVLSAKEISADRCVAVLPGGRARFLALKLHLDPRLEEASSEWHFLKFRMLRKLLEQKSIDLQSFATWLDSDPPNIEESRQLSLFGT